MKLFSISISKKSSCLLLDMRIYFFSSIPSFSQAWIALSNAFDRIMQKSISPTEQGNGTFKVLLENADYEKAKAYIEEMDIVTANLSFPFQTGNAVLDVLLENKAALAANKGITEAAP